MAVLMVLALVACGAGNDGTETEAAEANAAPKSESTNTAAESEPAAEGAKTITLAVDGEPRALTPFSAGGNVAGTFVRTLAYSPLWRISAADDSVIMVLAESYELDEENKTITVKLRDGLVCADGTTPITAEDVLCSLETANRDSGDYTANVDFDNTAVVDDQTIVIALKTIDNVYMLDLSYISIFSKEWTENGTNDEKKGSDILCTGPYVLQPWSTGNDMVYIKNEYYWDADSYKYDTITLKCIGDETTRYLEYCSGGIDICVLTKNNYIDEVESGASVGVLYQAPKQCVKALVFDTVNTDMFANQNLRLALCYGVDMAPIVEACCGPRYKVATSSFPSSSSWYTEASYSYDPELANEYLDAYYAETGASSVEFTCTVRAGTVEQDVAEALQYQYSQMGVTMNINQVDAASYTDLMVRGELYCSISGSSMGYYDPAKLVNAWRATSGNSLMHYAEDDMNELLNDAMDNGNYTREERYEVWAELQQRVKDYGKVIPIYEDISCWAINNDSISLEGVVNGSGALEIDLFMK